jgi:LPS export ABC transporter protein LptC
MRLIGFFIAFAGIFFFTACTSDKTNDEVFTTEDTLFEVADSVEILYSDSAIVRIRIKAPVLYNYLGNDNPRREFPKGILVEFFDDNKRIQSRLTAKYAVQYDKTNKFMVEDSVVVKSIKNEMIETEGLVWDESQQRVYSDRFITVTTPTEVIQGYGFESDYNFQNWVLKKVSGRLAANRINSSILEE